MHSKNKASLLCLAKSAEHGKVDSKNNHYVHSRWRTKLGRQIQVRLQPALRKSGCSLPSSSRDNAPLIMSKPGKSKPDPSSTSWSPLVRRKKGEEISFFLMVSNERWKSLALNVSRAWTRVYLPPCPGLPPKCTLMPPLCDDQDVPNLPSTALCFQPRGHQPARGAQWFHEHTGSMGWKTRGLRLWQLGYRNCRNQHISHFLTKKKYKKKSLYFKISWQGLCSQNLQARGGEDPALTHAEGSGSHQHGAASSACCWKTKNLERKDDQKKRKPMWIDSCFQFFSIFK